MSPPLYGIAEKVLVPHTDKQYEAKVLKAECRSDGVWYYYLHYHGWNKKWDEWVEEMGLQKAYEYAPPVEPALPAITNAATPPKKGNGGKAVGQTPVSNHGDSGLKSKKRKADEMADMNLQVGVDVPPILKKQLLDEYEVIISQNRTLSAPRRPNAMEILRQFVDYGGTSRCPVTELRELATGLEEYFDKSLEKHLLYKVEWEDAKKLLANGTCASAVFGAEHLLRLLIKLPDIVPVVPTTTHQGTTLRARLQDFANFLMANRHTFFAKFTEYRSRTLMPAIHGGGGGGGGNGMSTGTALIHTAPTGMKMDAALWSMRMETN
ncbi:hypothetical protein BSKO_09263 [Bryopsis sp. KO-2023]|nr:hypothetical protein BSKO_09263 [Bryopsis sp. KO-2023]